MSRLFVLREESQCRALYAYLKNNWPACAKSGKPLVVSVAEYNEKRNNPQNALMWALLAEIAEQAMVDGRRYPKECWHDHLRGELLGYVDLPNGKKTPISTTTLSVSEFAEYVNRIMAYAATELGVIFEERK